MKPTFRLKPTKHHQINDIDVDALLAAINELSESEVRYTGKSTDPTRVSINGHENFTFMELADAFELDLHDFAIGETHR